MNGDFTPNKAGFYTVQDIAEIEDFDKDQYGNTWYNVLFNGDAETYMWLAKNQPEKGKAYYGHLEPTKSGKRLRFKTDKQPEDVKPPSKAGTDYLKDTSDVPRSLIIELLKYYDVQHLYNSEHYTNMINLAQSLNDDIMSMIQGNRSGSHETVVPSPAQPIKAEITPAAGYDQFKKAKQNLQKAVAANEGMSEEELESLNEYPN